LLPIEQGKGELLLAAAADNLQDEVRKNLMMLYRDSAALSKNTWDSLLSSVNRWAQYCHEHHASWLPADPELFRLYLLNMHESGLSNATVRKHYSMINMLHEQAGLPKPRESKAVRLVMRRITRQSIEDGEEIGQAVPFHRKDLIAVCKVLDESDTLRNLRNAAFLHVAYSTLLRIAELGRIRVKNIYFEDQHAIIRVGFTKTIVTSEGVTKKLSTASSKRLQAWLTRSGLDCEPEAHVFCKVDKSDRVIINTAKPMDRKNLEGIFESAWGLVYPGERRARNKGRYDTWSGHSARVGAAQDMALAGVALPRILQAGNWSKPETVMRYLRNIMADDNPMLQMLEEDQQVK
jgi:integrase